MKKTLLIACALVLGFGAASTTLAVEPSDVVGNWATTPTEKGYAKVKVFEEDGKYFGEIFWLQKPTYDESEGAEWAGKEKVDRKNPDKGKRSQSIIGLRIVKNMKYAGEGQWEGGTIYDPENGKTYKSKMALEGDTLSVRGFIGFSFIGRTSKWTRVKEEMKEGMEDKMGDEAEDGMGDEMEEEMGDG